MTFRAVIFDFDGLIIDSETPIFDIWAGIYRDHGGRLTMEHWRHALGTHNGFDPYGELERQTGVRLSRDEWVPKVRDQHWRLCEGEPLRPGVFDRLAEARALGLPAAVASSSSLEWVGPWLARHGLRDLVDAVCTRDDVERVKPAPELFLLAAERIGVPPAQCVVFEDTPNGVAAAHAAGMWAVAVPSPITRALEFGSPHRTLTSLADCTLVELQNGFAHLSAPAPRSTP
ncbi:MAG: HAD-IA family hydrolase [Vicinamibacteria bacterium]|nr:HAD-IA family hydrolase [Vicinamibacteria bacterium]